MKQILTILILLSPLVTFSKSTDKKDQGVSLNMKCVTEFPTTSYLAKTEGEIVTVEMIHHNGTRFMPVYSGNVTPDDIPEITKRSELLQKLGERVEVTFKKENCNK